MSALLRSVDRDARAAQHALFADFYPTLAGWTYRLVGDRDLAHEMSTEAFTRLLARWTSVREPRPWLFMTASNLVRDHWRKRGRERAAYGKLGLSDGEVPQADLATTHTVRQVVQALPDRLRVPVLLHYFADLPVKQVAELTGKAEGTVKRALFDARAAMAAQLQEMPS